MPKKLDIYIVKKFLGSFIFSIMLFTMVAVIIDLTEKVNDIVRSDATIGMIVTQYYFMFIPYIDAILTPLFVFIAVIFFTSQLASRTEIIAMLASGVSLYRIMMPYLFSAFLIATMLFLANNFIVPHANKNRLAFEYAHLHNPNKKFNKNVHLQVEKDRYVYMENYSNTDSTGYKFSYEIIEDGLLKYKLRADRIKWDGAKQKWNVKNYMIRELGKDRDTILTGMSLDTVFNFLPKDFEKRISSREEMNTIELYHHIKMLKARGADQIEYYEIELYRRTADAVSVIILTLIGLAMASQKVRGGMGLKIVLGFLLSGAFIIFIQFSATFTTNGNLPAILGVAIPNVVFGILAVILIIKAPK